MSVVVPPPLGLLLSMVEQRQEAGGWDKVDTTRLRILQASSLSNVSLLIHLQAHNLTRHKYCQTKQPNHIKWRPYTDFQAMCRPIPIQCHISTQEDISSNSPFFPYIWLRALVRPIQQGPCACWRRPLHCNALPAGLSKAGISCKNCSAPKQCAAGEIVFITCKLWEHSSDSHIQSTTEPSVSSFNGFSDWSQSSVYISTFWWFWNKIWGGGASLKTSAN